MKLPFAAPSYDLESRPSGVARTVNMFPIPVEPGNERTAWVLKDAPGLEVWSLDPANEPDPCFDEVVLLIQRGEMVDRSTYARSLANEVPANPVTVDVTTGFPGGKGIRIGDFQHNASGIVMGAGAELTIGSGVRCFEAFVRVATGAYSAVGSSSQILFNDGFAGGGFYWFLDGDVPQGRMRIRVDGTFCGSPVACPVIPEAADWFIACQIYASGDVGFWAGPVGDAVAVGGLSLSNITAEQPIAAPAFGPFIGYVGGDGAHNDFIFSERVTTCERYAADLTEIPIPTTLWPEFGP